MVLAGAITTPESTGAATVREPHAIERVDDVEPRDRIDVSVE
jgi:hypothetical protein